MTGGAGSGGGRRGHRFSARAVLRSVTTGSSVVATVLALVVALAVGGVLIAFSDPSVLAKYGYFFAAPTDSLAATWNDISASYGALFRGAIVDPSTIGAALHGGSVSAVFSPISETVVAATPLIAAGLAVSLAFRAGLFNIGAEGQILMGALCSGVVGFAVSLPPVVHVTVAVLAGFAGGAVWGFVPGWLKARTGAHEVITTIMLNYIASNLMFFLLTTKAMQRPGRTDPISPLVAGTARLPHLAGPALRINAGFLVALAAAVAVGWLLTRSTVGFEFRAVGLNPDAARTAGIDVARTFVLVMVLSGGLAGLAGAAQVLGTEYALSPGISAGIGFTAITVALLGRASPLGTVLAGLLFGALQAGGIAMQAATETPVDVVTVIQSLIVLFIAAPPLIRALFRLRTAPSGTQPLARGW